MDAVKANPCVWTSLLFDHGSFVELGGLIKDADVTTGYGTINGRLVFSYTQYGPVNRTHAAKISNMYKSALKMGAPIVGFMDSPGFKLSDGLDGMEAYGQIITAQSRAKGVIPQISAVFGDCLGISALTAHLSDFILMQTDSGRLFMQSPNAYQTDKYNKPQPADMYCDDDKAMLEALRKLISYIPSNYLEDTVSNASIDDINRTDLGLNSVINEDGQYDMRYILSSITDHNDFFELKSEYGDSIITAFGKFNGYTAGILAAKGAMTKQALKKAHDFISFCNAFFIPVISLNDSMGYEGDASDDYMILDSAAELAAKLTSAIVPKVSIIIRRGIGSTYLLLNSKHLGADIVYAWSGAEITVMEPAPANKIMHMDIETSTAEAGAGGYIDAIIEPAETRKRIISSLEMLSSKRVR